MLMRSFSLILIMLSLTGCKHSHDTPYTLPGAGQKPITESFTRVQVDGDIDVALYTGDMNPRVILKGTPADKARIKLAVKNGVLHIAESKKHPLGDRSLAEIRTHYLTSFTYQGTGTITANNIQSRMLDLSIDNNGDTTLQGNMTLRKVNIAGTGRTQLSGLHGQIIQLKLTGSPHVQLRGDVDATLVNAKGNAWLSLYWVKSNAIKIRARGNAFIQMAGVAELLDVELWDAARFNGRYLRGMRVFTKTHGTSIADISVIRTQHTLASDSSNIYFHNLPEMKADFMAYNGAVLDLREWDSPVLQEYSRYNR